MKTYKVRTASIKDGFFELAFPTYGQAQQRKYDLKGIRDRTELIRYDLEVIEEAKKALLERSKDFIQDGGDVDGAEIIKENRNEIERLTIESRNIEDEITSEINNYNMMLFLQHLVKWSYKLSSEPLSIPESIDELKALQLDDRLISLFEESVVKIYDDEDLKKG